MLKGKVYYRAEDGKEVLIMSVEALAASRYCNKPIAKVYPVDIANTAFHLLTTNPNINAGHSGHFRFLNAGHEVMTNGDFVRFEAEKVDYVSEPTNWHVVRR